jgi:hypothetical protein
MSTELTFEELTFDSFARELIDASSILPDDAIAGYHARGKIQPIMLFVYRIAAYTTQELRNTGKTPETTDDTDYIDAVQECILHAPQLVNSWLKHPSHKFSTYVNAACKNIVKDYLWGLAKGGTGSNNSAAGTVDQLPDIDPHVVDELSDDFEPSGDYAHGFAYDPSPQGYRDPMEELIAAEEEDAALRALMRPAATPAATKSRNIRARKLLGLKGAAHNA